ncbi:MAG TPA: HAMP domain-containing sensor histidine kinase [Clostridia bacterium]|nr:HAMP domain-containing sensor histidine kinase [Clostridia bacterium]
MLGRGITKRWLINSMGVIFAILAVVWIFFALSIRGYYYSNVMTNLRSRAQNNSSNFTRMIDTQNPDFYGTAYELVDSFLDKDKMELMILDKNGIVLATTSGFTPADTKKYQDFLTASSSSSGIGEWNGVDDETGEKIMAVTSMLKDSDGNVMGASRYVVSLSKIDMQIAIFVLISGIICLAIILFVVMSGTYFINSIVIPVRDIGATARRIASGDFEVRIDKQYDDEIGELCDTINYMAGELGATDRMKNDFISSVSHELRTPLTAIKGWGETILSSGPSDRETLSKGMTIIIDETERLSSMVEELLDFSRMQNGKFKLIMDKIDILAELGEAVLMFSDRAHREGLMFIYNEPASLPPVMGDRNRLRQVFLNILDNAFKYSDPGGTVTVSTVDNTDHLKVIISDTGCGISGYDLPKVKNKFFKANSTRRGSGIGLAVADEIVCLHGGTLELDSQEGKGTTVTITLPSYPK